MVFAGDYIGLAADLHDLLLGFDVIYILNRSAS